MLEIMIYIRNDDSSTKKYSSLAMNRMKALSKAKCPNYSIFTAAFTDPKSIPSILNQKDALSDLIHNPSTQVLKLISNFPTVALLYLLSTLYNETSKDVSNNNKTVSSSNTNNKYSILKFVRRIVNLRYSFNWEKSYFVNPISKDDRFQQEEWLICLIFMIGFHAIKTEIGKPQIQMSTMQEKPHPPDSFTDISPKQIKKESTNLQTFLTLVCIIEDVGMKLQKLKVEAINLNVCYQESQHDLTKKRNKEEVPSILHVCFPKQMMQFKQLQVQLNPKQRNESSMPSSSEITQQTFHTKYIKRRRLRKISSIDVSTFSQKKSPDKSNKKRKNSELEDSSIIDLVYESSYDSDMDTNNSSEMNPLSQPFTTNPIDKNIPKSSGLDTTFKLTIELQLSAKKLRESLLHLKHTNCQISSDKIIQLSDTFVQLLQQSSSIDTISGEQGIEIMGNYISYGKECIATGDNWLDNGKNENNVINNTRSRHVPNMKEELSLIDTIVFHVTKSFVTGNVSSIRVSSFMKSCVLPLCFELGRTKYWKEPHQENTAVLNEKDTSASRLLVRTITSLIEKHPKECVTSIFLPLLLQKNTFSQENIGDNDNLGANIAQCELVSRVIKEMHLPLDSISLLLSCIITTFMSTIKSESTNDEYDEKRTPILLTDHFVSVMITCIQHKPKLAVGDIRNMIFCIVNVCQEFNSNICESVKFASLFHTFLLKYGEQMKELGELETLFKAAMNLKTFLKTSIHATLKRLSR